MQCTGTNSPFNPKAKAKKTGTNFPLQWSMCVIGKCLQGTAEIYKIQCNASLIVNITNCVAKCVRKYGLEFPNVMSYVSTIVITKCIQRYVRK